MRVESLVAGICERPVYLKILLQKNKKNYYTKYGNKLTQAYKYINNKIFCDKFSALII